MMPRGRGSRSMPLAAAPALMVRPAARWRGSGRQCEVTCGVFDVRGDCVASRIWLSEEVGRISIGAPAHEDLTATLLDCTLCATLAVHAKWCERSVGVGRERIHFGGIQMSAMRR